MFLSIDGDCPNRQNCEGPIMNERDLEGVRRAAESGDTRWAAAFLDLAPSTLNKMRIVGTGPSFYRLGRAVRYRRVDLEQWRNRFRATSTTEADATLPRSLNYAGMSHVAVRTNSL